MAGNEPVQMLGLYYNHLAPNTCVSIFKKSLFEWGSKY